MKVLGFDISFKKSTEIQNKANPTPRVGKSNPAVVKIIQNMVVF
ncbi:hypothetical protein [Capnocytophaga canimorsus]|nr:hypothetical protein [Capnocytophaga canimorsus]